VALLFGLVLLGLAGGEVIRELPDRAYETADPRQALDLYLPAPDSTGASRPPIAIFVHGGVWAMGDRKLGANVGRALAESGIVAAVLSYRLAPAHRHPAQIEDVAAAVAYLVRNAAEVGADSNRVFLIGHSAGGQLVSLLALDPSWLTAEGIDPKVIAGVAALSGIFDLEAPFGDPGQDTGKDYVERVFGPQGPTWHAASPIRHLAGADTTRPFLLVMAERDYAGIRTQTETMRAALAQHRVPVELADIPGRDHYELVNAIGSEGDSLTVLLRRFIAR
jgi:acetyl esterase/lipase